MDICQLKNAELEAKHQKYRGRVVLRVIVKDDSGSYAVFTEQGSWASQMTAAKIMDIISRLPACDGQAADAVSAYTQVKMEDAHKLLRIPKLECPDIWIRLPRHKWPKSWSSMEEDPVVPLERNLYGHLLAGLLWEKEFEKILLKHGWEKIPNWECLFVSSWKSIILICVCGWHKETKSWFNVETTQQRSRLGRINIILGSRILGLHSTTLRNKQKYCGQLQTHVRIANFSWGITEITIPSKSSYFFMVLWHGWSYKKVCRTYCELGNKTTQQLYKVSTPCASMTTTSKKKKWNLLENCHTDAVKFF